MSSMPPRNNAPIWWDGSTFEYSKVLSEQDGVVFKWFVDSHRREIHLGLSVPETGWVGLGVSAAGSMKGADIAIVNKVSSESNDELFQVGDYFSKDFELPVRDPDGLQNFVLIHAERNGTRSWVHVKRPLVTCDSYNDLKIGLFPMSVMYAFGPGEEPMYHGTNHRGSALVSLLINQMVKLETPFVPDNSIFNLVDPVHGFIVTAPFQDIMVPAGGKSKVSTVCTSSCTSVAFPKDGVNLLYVVPRAHKTAKRVAVRHIRNGKELGALIETDYFDFKKQAGVYMNRKLFQGDSFIVECEYDGAQLNHDAYGGSSTADEMCLAYFAVYPEVKTHKVCTPTYCGPNLGHAFHGTNKNPNYTTEVMPQEWQFEPLDPKDDICYVALIQGVCAPMDWAGFSVTLVIVQLAVVCTFLVIRILLHKFSKQYRAMTPVHKANTANYATALVALSASFVFAMGAFHILVGTQDLFVTDDDGKLAAHDRVSSGMMAAYLVVVFFLIELVTKNQVGIAFLLHHIITVALGVFLAVVIFHTLSVQFVSLGLVLLFHANTEQPTYVALLRMRLGYTTTSRDFFVAALWALVSKTSIFVAGMVILTQPHLFQIHFKFLPHQEMAMSIGIKMLVGLNCALFVVQLYQALVLFQIAKLKRGGADANITPVDDVNKDNFLHETQIYKDRLHN